MFDNACSLTQAVKECRKTNTRRQEKVLDKEVQKHEETYKVPFSIVSQYYDFGKERLVIRTPKEVIYVKPRYKVGEVVAVAQKYEDIYHGLSDREASWFLDTLHLRYDDKCARDLPAWRNKEFVLAYLMPHRIRITEVRVERLQDISDEDCLREGIIEDCQGVQYSFPTEIGYCGQYPFDTPRDAFAALIDRISGKGTWKSNPWVFVYEFELVK